MRLIEVLPNYEVSRFNRPPMLTGEEQKQYFRMDETITKLLQNTREDDSKLGLRSSMGILKLEANFIPKECLDLRTLNLLQKLLALLRQRIFLCNTLIALAKSTGC